MRVHAGQLPYCPATGSANATLLQSADKAVVITPINLYMHLATDSTTGISVLIST